MNGFPKKILLATDGSEDAARAARTAVDLCNNTGSELHVVTVGQVGPEYDTWGTGMSSLLRREAQEVLDRQVKEIEEAGGTVTKTHLGMGRPEREIVDLAEEIDADLMVVGSRGLGGVRRALLGSVSEVVVHHAHCPVLVVRGEPAVFPTRVLVATDGSEEASLAARTAAELAARTGSELHVVRVAYLVPMPSYPTETSHMARRLYAESREEEKRRAGELLDEQVRKIEDAGARVTEAHLRMGRPDEEIVRLGEELKAGLAIVGSRGLSPVKRMLIGSVSDSVVRHAHSPVLVVRREQRAR